MDRQHYDFKNKIFGFTPSQNLDLVLVALEQAGVSRSQIDCLDSKERHEFIENLEHSSNLLTRIRFTADKYIGSGPAEFIRDLKDAPVSDMLICIDLEDRAEKEHIFDILRKTNVHKIKYFHPMYTEHATTESGHRQEITPVK